MPRTNDMEREMNEQSGNSGQFQQHGAGARLNEPFGDSEQLALPDTASAGDALIDVADPWRGLYRPEQLRANGDGDMYHPDLPSWPDDREDALDKLVHAQGFDFQVVAGDFSDEAIEAGDELYWQEMRAWNPEAPEGEWRLAWKGDTEDGPYAWFVRPMALRPEPEAIATPPAKADRMAIKMLVAAGFVSEDKANESLRIAHGFGGDLGQPAPAAAVQIERDAQGLISSVSLAGKVVATNPEYVVRASAQGAPAAVPVDVVVLPHGIRLIEIPARNNLDPINVFVQNYALGRGRIVVTCYGQAWCGFWGAMGNRTVMQFVAACDADYVAGNMLSGRQGHVKKNERTYVGRIATEVIAEFRALLATHPQPAAADCARCSGSGEDPEGFYDQTKGPDGGTHEGPCRSCGGSGDQQAKPEVQL